ncbi:MAG TPA: Os1348 family NHLP clan protein [Candidatus Limnocylindria bacterium]|nr:Os1348 family NHLP clan protein [Candidatus Limnocylindria bacterium]
MTQAARDAILERAMTDPAFRSLLARDPAKALAGYDLTSEERAMFQTGTARAERLEDRMSKSDLAAAVAVKTSSPLLKSPSQNAKKRR